MMASVVVEAEDAETAFQYIAFNLPQLLQGTTISRVYRVQHAVIDWPTGEFDIVERTSES
jgi:hypothetical protein